MGLKKIRSRQIMAKTRGRTSPDIDKAMAKLSKKLRRLRKEHADLATKVAKLRAEKLPWLKPPKE